MGKLLNEFKDDVKEVRNEQKRKEAQRNPSEFTRIFMASICIVNGILAGMIAMTIIGIPVAFLMILADVWIWRRYVIKKPIETEETA